MINFPDERELEALTAFNEQLCLSVYLPLLDPNTTANSSRIEFKNMLKDAKLALLAAGATKQEIDKTLEPARQLLTSHDLWPPQHQNLALFMHPKMFRYYHIPSRAKTYIMTVEKGFNLKPLRKILKSNITYFVLALSHKNVRFYQGDHFHLELIKLKNFPADMKQALNIDEYPNWLETHSIGLGRGNEKTSDGFHGQYNVHQTDKDMLLKFFRLIDVALHRFLLTKHRPLIIIGVEYLLPIYRQANSYPLLVKGGLTGNFEKTDLDTIHHQTWEYLENSLPS